MFDQKTFPFPADVYTKRSKSKHIKNILQEFEDARNPPFLHLPIEQWPISRTLAIPKTCTATSLDLESKNEVSREAAVSALQDAKQPALETVLFTKQTTAAHTVAEPEFSRRLVASRFYSVENCAPTRVMGVIFYYCDKLLHLSKKSTAERRKKNEELRQVCSALRRPHCKYLFGPCRSTCTHNHIAQNGIYHRAQTLWRDKKQSSHMNDDDGSDNQMMMVSDDDDRVTGSTQSLSQLPRVGYKKLTEFLVNRQTITAARGPESCYHRVRELYGQLADNFLSSIYSIKSTENLSALELYNYPVNKKCTMITGLGREQKALFQGLKKIFGIPSPEDPG